MRDITLGDTIYPKFTTRAFATGVPTTLAGTPVLSVYEENNITQITSGVSISVDYDSVTGLHQATIIATSGNGYEVGKSYDLVITTGTVGGVSVIGEVVASFTVEAQAGHKRLGAPAGATIAADLVVIDNFVDGIETAVITNAVGADVSADLATLQADTDDIQTRLPAALVSGLMSSDMTAISAETLAADNLQLQYNTTGLTGDTFPSTQSQLSGLANVGSAVHKPALSYTLTTGTQSANTVSDTEALNAVRHTHTDTAGVMDLYYEFNIGSGTISSTQVTGYVTGNNDDLDVFGYDWVSASWKQIGNIQGTASTANGVYSLDMFVDMVGSGANEGVVRVRFYKASGLSSATLAIDQIFVAFNQGVEGYDNGSVWLDTNLTNTNTVVGVDGVARNPVSTIAAANTLLASTNLHRIEVAPGSSFTFAAAQVDQTFKGHDWTLAFGGQDCSGTYIEGATVSGIATSPTGVLELERCIINTVSLGAAHLHRCGFTGNTTTLTAASDYVFNECFSQVAGTGTPIIDFGAALGNTNLNIAHYSNGIQIDNLNANGTDNFSISGVGQIVYAASSSGTVNQRGDWKVTNTGGVTINEDDNTANLAAVLVDTADIQPKIGSPSANVSADIAAIKVDTAAVLIDTADIQPKIGTPATDISADIAAVKVDTAATLVDTGTTIPGTITALQTDSTNLLLGIIFGAAATGTLTTTQATSDLSGYTVDQLVGRTIIVTSGVADGEGSDITAYSATNGLLTFTAMSLAMGNGDTFKIV